MTLKDNIITYIRNLHVPNLPKPTMPMRSLIIVVTSRRLPFESAPSLRYKVTHCAGENGKKKTVLNSPLAVKRSNSRGLSLSLATVNHPNQGFVKLHIEWWVVPVAEPFPKLIVLSNPNCPGVNHRSHNPLPRRRVPVVIWEHLFHRVQQPLITQG